MSHFIELTETNGGPFLLNSDLILRVLPLDAGTLLITSIPRFRSNPQSSIPIRLEQDASCISYEVNESYSQVTDRILSL